LTMHLLLVGISHKTAPVELRERLDFQVRGIDRALQALAARGSTREAVVLSTCNRAEVYVACDDVPATLADLVTFVSEFNAVDEPAVAPHVYDVADLEAARHLFRVAAGLESLVVGEPQVFGQVKEAHTIAGEVRTVGPVLNRLFHSSFVVGKRVRTETGLGSGSVSISYAAVALARKIFGDLGGRTVAVVGAGEVGKLTARHIKTQGVHHVTIVSRTMAHAARTAEAIGGATAAPWEDLDGVLGKSDIVITATGAAAPILTKARIEAIMRPRRNRPLFIIDIALPRDVEAAAGEIEQVFLYNIDDLQATVRENLARRASEVAHAEAIVGEELEKFGAWLRSREAIPTVVALRQKFENIRRAELERLDYKLASLPREARERARSIVGEITHLIVEKLLLTPTEQLKSLGDTETVGAYTEALTRLFGLSDRDHPDAEDERQTDRRPPVGSAHPEPVEGRVEPFTRTRHRGPR
jgi:glutamyl-tRNA reductase